MPDIICLDNESEIIGLLKKYKNELIIINFSLNTSEKCKDFIEKYVNTTSMYENESNEIIFAYIEMDDYKDEKLNIKNQMSLYPTIILFLDGKSVNTINNVDQEILIENINKYKKNTDIDSDVGPSASVSASASTTVVDDIIGKQLISVLERIEKMQEKQMEQIIMLQKQNMLSNKHQTPEYIEDVDDYVLNSNNNASSDDSTHAIDVNNVNNNNNNIIYQYKMDDKTDNEFLMILYHVRIMVKIYLKKI